MLVAGNSLKNPLSENNLGGAEKRVGGSSEMELGLGKGGETEEINGKRHGGN